MAVTKIANIGNGFPHRSKKVLARKCRLYIAKGNIDNVVPPATIAALTALFTGTTAVYVPLGDMDNAGSNISWVERTYDIDFETIGLGYDITGTFVGVTVTEAMLDFCTNLGGDQYTILCVPDGVNNIFFAMSGVSLTTEGSLNVVENDGVSKITFKASRKADNLTDVVKYRELTA